MHERISRDPYLQGDLDALCGLYSIINACVALCPEFDDDLANSMFRRGVKALKDYEDGMSLSILYEGIDFQTLTSVAHSIAGWIEKRTGILLLVSAFEQRLTSATRMSALWHRIAKLTSSDAVIVTALMGHHNHWTTIVSADDRKLVLSDSDDLTIIPRHRCTLKFAIDKHILTPSEMLVIHRAADLVRPS